MAGSISRVYGLSVKVPLGGDQRETGSYDLEGVQRRLPRCATEPMGAPGEGTLNPLGMDPYMI
jgi:hypothetical protein